MAQMIGGQSIVGAQGAPSPHKERGGTIAEDMRQLQYDREKGADMDTLFKRTLKQFKNQMSPQEALGYSTMMENTPEAKEMRDADRRARGWTEEEINRPEYTTTLTPPLPPGTDVRVPRFETIVNDQDQVVLVFWRLTDAWQSDFQYPELARLSGYSKKGFFGLLYPNQTTVREWYSFNNCAREICVEYCGVEVGRKRKLVEPLELPTASLFNRTYKANYTAVRQLKCPENTYKIKCKNPADLQLHLIWEVYKKDPTYVLPSAPGRESGQHFLYYVSDFFQKKTTLGIDWEIDYFEEAQARKKYLKYKEEYRQARAEELARLEGPSETASDDMSVYTPSVSAATSRSGYRYTDGLTRYSTGAASVSTSATSRHPGIGDTPRSPGFPKTDARTLESFPEPRSRDPADAWKYEPNRIPGTPGFTLDWRAAKRAEAAQTKRSAGTPQSSDTSRFPGTPESTADSKMPGTPESSSMPGTPQRDSSKLPGTPESSSLPGTPPRLSALEQHNNCVEYFVQGLVALASSVLALIGLKKLYSFQKHMPVLREALIRNV